MPSTSDVKKAEMSYLSSAVDSINPWAGSRSTTPTRDNNKDDEARAPAPEAAPEDHIKTALYGQSFRTYPKDAPPLNVQWFHAVDVPKRKPQHIKGREEALKDAKPAAQAKKYTAFSTSDSRRLEGRYQRLLEAAEDNHELRFQMAHVGGPNGNNATPRSSTTPNRPAAKGARVPVNEDFLFDVNIEDRELAPAYWLGPVYDVRRGSWFFQEGSNLRPCEENLAAQLEEGYLKMKPWQSPARSRSPSAAKAVSTNSSKEKVTEKQGESAEASSATLSPPNKSATTTTSSTTNPPQAPQPQSYRLFGPYMNNVATYPDASTAWLSTDGIMSWVTTSVYERFAGGGYLSGVKLIRGFTEPNKVKEKDKEKEKEKEKDEDKDKDKKKDKVKEQEKEKEKENISLLSTRETSGRDEQQQNVAYEEPEDSSREAATSLGRSMSTDSQSRQALLQRQISSLLEGEGKSIAETDEEIRKRDEQEIQDDYNVEAGETQGREIEHLILVTHGIGQRLGLRMESINFVHDVNILRKTIKAVYAQSNDLKVLNSELEAGHGNCRVQVLPVCWRHLIEFPRQRQGKREHDLSDASGAEDDYPSLEDITVEGMAFARSLIADLALDVLLYQSSYREEISRVVVAEANRILRQFRERNPEFNGRVHLAGHSLGSAIFFDVLCRQREHQEDRNPLRFWPSPSRPESTLKDHELQFDFNVDDYFCLGSPVGLFQMLKGRTIAARHTPHAIPSESPLCLEETGDPFLAASTSDGNKFSSVSGLPYTISSPKVAQLFNIFHPSDPVSYRIEPLISPAMAALKPQPLPYTKKSIFESVAPPSLTGIGTKVGQSVTGFWSSLSTGFTNNVLSRNLGLTSEDVARLAAGERAKEKNPEDVSKGSDGRSEERKWALPDSSATGQQQQNLRLAGDEIETLYSAFQKNQGSLRKDKGAYNPIEEGTRANKLLAEETKLRALNRNGRVDYSIQESAYDFNPINTIASHMGYWADEDVSHFMLSQLLSNRVKAPYGKGACQVGQVKAP